MNKDKHGSGRFKVFVLSALTGAHRRPYSYRNTSAGAMRVALRAG
jgi:hypothetical protein